MCLDAFDRATLTRLADQTNEDLADEFMLLGILTQPPKITPGMVRSMLKILRGAGYVVDLPEPAPASNQSTPTAEKPPVQPAYRDDSDSGHELHPTWTPEQHDLYRRAADAIRAIAVDGYMPAAATWNAERAQGAPADLPAAQTLLNRLGCKWNELAAWLGLKMQRPGNAAQSRAAKPHKIAPLPDTGNPPGAKSVPPLSGTLLVGPDGLATGVVKETNGEMLTERNRRVYGEN